jgi:hypothetical protein
VQAGFSKKSLFFSPAPGRAERSGIEKGWTHSEIFYFGTPFCSCAFNFKVSEFLGSIFSIASNEAKASSRWSFAKKPTPAL